MNGYAHFIYEHYIQNMCESIRVHMDVRVNVHMYAYEYTFSMSMSV